VGVGPPNRWQAKWLFSYLFAVARSYTGVVTPEELANLAHLRRARDLMDREYARPLDVAALARAALMSSAHFSRQFRAAYGETPYAYLMTRRIERAKALLRGGELSVTEVCMAVGCTSLGSFSARFTQLVGETPTAYRARDHSVLASVPGCVARDLTRPTGKPASGPSERAGLRRQGPDRPEPRAEQDRRSARGARSLVLGA
jgi:AraC-like DNA-binding protein